MNAAARIVPGTPGWPSPGATGPFTMDRTGCRSTRTRRGPSSRPPPGAVDAHCHVFGPGRAVPVRARAQIHARATRRRTSSSRCATSSASSATSSSRPPATAPTIARWSMRCTTSDGRARGVATVGRDVTDAELRALHAAGVRGVRFNFVQAARRCHAARGARRASRAGSRRSAGTSSSISRPPDLPEL